MGLKKELQKTYLLKYKFLFEENKQIKIDAESGRADLAAHLNEFRKRLTQDSSNQVESFDKLFFPKDASVESCNILTPETEDGIIKSKNKNNSKKPVWFKKLFREIVFMTHPDKINNFPIPAVVKKYSKIYLLANESYENDIYSDILMIGADLDLELPPEQVKKYILPKIDTLSSQIKDAKEGVGYQWAHITFDQKETFLSNYLRQLGFVFTKEEVKEVLIRRSNRKVGTRPVKQDRRKLK
jgi:hypothetical protein